MEELGSLIVLFTSDTDDGDIEYRIADTATLTFGSLRTLMMAADLNDVSSTKQPFVDELVLIASTNDGPRKVVGVTLSAD